MFLLKKYFRLRQFFKFRQDKKMGEGHTNSWLTRFFKGFLFSPVNLVFIIALSWFGAKAYLWEPSFTNKIIFFGIIGLWMFWIIARYMIILFVVLALLGGGYYAYYQYSNREIKKCEESGGVWNKETKTCEAKLTIWQKIDRWFQQAADKTTSEK